MLLTGVYNTGLPKKGARYTPLDSAPIEADPKRFYTTEFQNLTRAKLARIRCPILIIQGDKRIVNHFNAEILIPELRAAGKKLEVLTYPGEPHCFCFYGAGPRTPRPGIASRAYDDIAAFCRSHVRTKPKALIRALLNWSPLRWAKFLGSHRAPSDHLPAMV